MTSSRRTPTDAEALAAVLAERAEEEAGLAGGEEPGEDELLDYLEDRLAPEAEAALQRRLVASPEAAHKLLDLEDLLAAGAAARGEAGDQAATAAEKSAEEPADFAMRAGWRDLRRRLPRRSGARSQFPPLLTAIAATLLVAVVGLGTWVWELESERSGGFVVGEVASLELGAASRSAEGEAVEIEPGDSLRLAIYAEERCPEYRVEVSGPNTGASPGPGRAETRTRGGLERDEFGLVTPLLVRPAPGRYTVRLLGCEPEREISLHGFEIARPGNATRR
jgi:hypothetical protein